MSMAINSIFSDVMPMKKIVLASLLSPEMHPDRVGERITALREALRLSKAQFADSLGLDRSTLTKVEAGTKGLDIVVGAKIAEFYGAGLDYTYRGVLTDIPVEMRAEISAQIHASRMRIFYGKSSAATTKKGD
jgi:transcriptional regulator with XRE-family HTH domain